MGADRLILSLARRQHGVVASRQLAVAGVTPDVLRHRLACGWLERRHRGVYLVGPLSAPHSAAMAAVLACGDEALLSHGAAAVLWELRPPPPRVLDVTVVGHDRRSRDGIRVHRIGHLHPADATQKHGIPVTSPARTLLDLAVHASQRDTERAADEARLHHLVTEHSLTEQFSRYPRHPGTARLKHALRTEPKLTRSEAERRFLELIRAARLPEPRTNVRVSGFELDFLWPEQRLVVEVDGFAVHSRRSSFERDRRRDAELTLAGYRVIRVTWRQITEEPEAVVAILAAALAAQPRRPSLARSSTVSA